MSLQISDEIVKATKLTEPELRREIALHLFETGRLTIGYASRLAGFTVHEFREVLRVRQIPLYSYDVEDLDVDLASLRALGRL